ncbi:endolytic transglycosylase MltG [Nevskia sp.]|uniref:endolytic transglycosylase MltG n=1 Tax=Nevskia sp. TaxID=1929292 RepID=UPI0025FEB9BC|nr:endolytic transglycosylase MltG [Nevskia sp.]
MSRAAPKKTKKSRLLGVLLRLVLLVALLAVAFALDVKRELAAPLAIEAPISFEIAPGSSLPRVLAVARERGIFRSARQGQYLRVLARVQGAAQAIKAGEYRLEPGIRPRELLALWVSGKTVLQTLQLIEGWRFADAVKLVRAAPTLSHTLPENIDAAALMTALGRSGQASEGRLFPDTYRYTKGMSDVAFLRNALAAMDQVLAEEWALRMPNLPYDAPEQALTMASIIEKETGVSSEREQIAGVFVRRLQLGMRLQTDPTVIYGIGEAYDGNIRSKDLLADTPYNTYTRDGLPPTPICLPGREAIHAALHPAEGDALYFVAKGDGTHHFSATLSEHNFAVKRYQLGGAAR